MPVSPVRPYGVSTESNLTPNENVTKHDPALSESSGKPELQKPVPKTAAPANQKTQRENTLKNSARAGRKGAPATSAASTGPVWNAGLTLACELVQAATLSTGGRDESTGFSMRELEEMIRPLAPTAKAEPPTVAAFIADAITRLKNGESPERNAAFIQSLENLATDIEDVNAQGFHVVMAAMAAAVGIAESIRNTTVDDASHSVSRLLENSFPKHIASLLEGGLTQAPQAKKLVTMANSAMTVAFEYGGLRISNSLSHSRMNWMPVAESKETKASHEKLKDALRGFLDALTGKGNTPL